jgi:hypothetical protein
MMNNSNAIVIMTLNKITRRTGPPDGNIIDISPASPVVPGSVGS